MDNNTSGAGWRGPTGLVVVVVGALGMGAMYYGSGIGTETSKKSSLPPADGQTHKPVRAMNLALGPMVFLARELDFAVRNLKGDTLEDGRIAARVETQLKGLREIYRREIAKNPKLVGKMLLQLSVNPAGQVSQVKEITSRLDSSEFRQTVAAESAKWSFADLTTEPLTVQIPLLFVLEGMDITTLVRWESSLAGAPEKVAVAPAAKAEAIQPAKAGASPTRLAAVAKPAPATEKAAPASVTTQGEEVQIKYATLLRKEPNFTAPVLTTFTIGTRVIVINRSSDWLEVRSQYNGPSGYIRKEFIVPVDVVAHH
jgi:Bacterial SH3 domain